MKNYLVPVILSLVIGFLSSKFMFNQYDYKTSIKGVFNAGEKVFFLQQGVYSSVDGMKDNMSKFKSYIYSFDNDKYYTYVGITKKMENADKLKGYFKDLGYDIYVKEIYLDNSEFLIVLNNYDNLLLNTNEKEIIEAINKEILNEYQIKVVKNEN
jgi:hypothetical protein